MAGDIYSGPMTQRTPLNQALCMIWYALTGGNITGGGGIVLGGKQETRTVTQNASTATPYTIPAGWLSYTLEMSSDFTGTVNGIARTGAATPSISDYASPGNTGPAIAVVRTAGNYTITEGRAS